MSGRKRSAVWTCFSETAEKKAKCNFCFKIVKIGNGSTGNLNRHLQINHPSVDLTRSNHPDFEAVETVPVANIRDEPSSSTASVSETPFSSTTSADPGTPTATVPIFRYQNQATQPRISSFITRSINASRSKSINDQLVRMVVKEYQPLSIVDDDEFKKLVYMLNPGYNLPSRKTLTKNLIPQAFAKVSDSVSIELSKTTAVALTADCWTSISQQSYSL